DARAVERTVGTPELLDARERLLGLAKLALARSRVALEEEADAVIVPALPLGDVARRVLDRRRDSRDGKRHAVGGKDRDGQDVLPVLPVHVAHEARVELPVEELHLEGERLGQSFRHLEAIVNDAGGYWRDRVVVERDEDVLRVPAIDPLAVTIEKIDVHEVGPRIDVAAVVEPTAPSDDAIAGLDGHIEPDVVRVARSLREVMADLQRADEDLE